MWSSHQQCCANFRVAADHDIPAYAFCINGAVSPQFRHWFRVTRGKCFCVNLQKITGLLCLHQNKNAKTFISSFAMGIFFPSQIAGFPHLMTLHSRFFTMTVIQLKWMNCCFTVALRKFLAKLFHESIVFTMKLKLKRLLLSYQTLLIVS